MIYNWKELFSSDVFILEKGVDFVVGQASIAGQVRNAATKYGVKVSITETTQGLIVRITSRKEMIS